MAQTSFHSEAIFDLLISTFASADDSRKLANLDSLKQRSGVSDDEWNGVLAYAAQVLSNLSNFKSFGATKFVPRVAESAFEAVISASERKDVAVPLWKTVGIALELCPSIADSVLAALLPLRSRALVFITLRT